MRYYLLAGEASGDLHGANLMRAIKEKDPKAQFRFWGGDLMQQVGGTLVKHYKERAFMGFIEVILNLVKILRLITFCKSDILVFKPDALVFIDNSGFNLPIAKWAKKKGFTTHYYISPQVWASRPGRTKTIKTSVDHMYVVLPFVKDFYSQWNYEVNFVGHPLIDAIASYKFPEEAKFRAVHHLDDRPIIALLPGSRRQEIKTMLRDMLRLVSDYPNFQFVIAGAPSQSPELYHALIDKSSVRLVCNETYSLLRFSTAALVTSGTATLETALLKVPQVVCYKGNWISYQIAKRIVKLQYISLVNLILDKPVVAELIQNDFTYQKLKKALQDILKDPNRRSELFSDYNLLEAQLGSKGASAKTAHYIVTTTLGELK